MIIGDWLINSVANIGIRKEKNHKMTTNFRDTVDNEFERFVAKTSFLLTKEKNWTVKKTAKNKIHFLYTVVSRWQKAKKKRFSLTNEQTSALIPISNI